VASAHLTVQHGIDGDAHAGPRHRRVSLLSHEKVEESNRRGARVTDGEPYIRNITPPERLVLPGCGRIGQALLPDTGGRCLHAAVRSVKYSPFNRRRSLDLRLFFPLIMSIDIIGIRCYIGNNLFIK